MYTVGSPSETNRPDARCFQRRAARIASQDRAVLAPRGASRGGNSFPKWAQIWHLFKSFRRGCWLSDTVSGVTPRACAKNTKDPRPPTGGCCPVLRQAGGHSRLLSLLPGRSGPTQRPPNPPTPAPRRASLPQEGGVVRPQHRGHVHTLEHVAVAWDDTPPPPGEYPPHLLGPAALIPH